MKRGKISQQNQSVTPLPEADRCLAKSPSNWKTTPPIIPLSMVLCGTEDALGQLWSAVPAVSPPSLLPAPWRGRVRRRGSPGAVQAPLSNSRNVGAQQWKPAPPKDGHSVPARPSTGWLLSWQVALAGDHEARGFWQHLPFSDEHRIPVVLGATFQAVWARPLGMRSLWLFFNAPLHRQCSRV